MNISPERQKYHNLLKDFSGQITGLVYDIGKSDYHNYSNLFANIKTIDRELKKNPDICTDIEKINKEDMDHYLETAHAVLCNGVIEQCDNPFRMIEACHVLLKHAGLALFGMCLLGYPSHDLDRFRFTRQGAELAITRAGFKIMSTDVVQRDNKDSYIYVVAQKE